MNLEHEFSYSADIQGPTAVGPGPLGDRNIFEIIGGKVIGGRLSGKLGTGGSDWILVGPDGYSRVDVRGTIITDDGASIYMQILGVAENTDVAAAAISGEGPATQFEDHYIRVSLFLETGDPRYAWVNQTAFVGEVRILPTPGVECRVYRLT